MNYNIFFSPTGGTKKVSDILVSKLFDNYLPIDLSNNPFNCSYNFGVDDVCLVSVPSFGGRVPETAVKRLKTLKGNGARAVICCVYGNRDYDDTLLELFDTLEDCGFLVISAVVAIAEHSIMPEYASGRPDEMDTHNLYDCAKKIRYNIDNNIINKLNFKGNRPYKKYNGVPFKPTANAKCTSCGMCAKACPVGAISFDNLRGNDKSKCISCMRCIKVCPVGARELNKSVLAVATLSLKKACSKRKEVELYI